jgi:hypothetical protein
MDASSDWVVSGGAGALDFDGSNDWVNVNDNTSLDIASGGSLTISAWIYRTANVAAYETIVTKRLSDGQTTNYEFSLNNSSTGNSKALIFYSGGSFTLSTTLVSLSAWTHVSTVTNASGTTYYVNGLSAGTSVTLVGSPNNHPFKIGGVAGSPETQFLNAALDDIRIYNRALSATEISLLSKERGIGFKTSSRTSSVFAKRYSYKPPKDKTYAAITRSQSDYDSLREGLVLAICPSVSGATGYRAVDVSGKNNHGTLQNMTPDDWVVSNGNIALDFDGSNDFITCSSLINGNLGSSDATICLWAKLENSSAQRTLIAKRSDSGVFPQWQLTQGNVTTAGGANAGKHIGIFWYKGGFINDTANNQCFRTTNDVVDGNWHHIVFRRINGTTPTFWIDGVSVPVTAVVNGTTNINADHVTDPITIASSTVAGAGFVNGQMDDIRVYSRALSGTEIRQLASRRGIGLQSTPRHTDYIETREKTYSVVVKSQQEHSSLSEGLVGAWCPSLGASGYRLVDRSGYGNHGTLTNMDAATDWVSSNGVALDFDGSDDFVDNNPWTTNIGTGNFSVSAWVKTSSATRQAILAAYDGDSPDQGMIFDILNTGKVRCSAIGPNSATNLIFSDGNTSVDTGAWVHVCGVRTSSAMAIYVNGKLDTASTTSLGNPNVSITGSHRIGLTRSDAGYSAPFNGQIDDVRVYTRALTPSEIRLLASKRGIGLRSQKQTMFYQFPSGSKRRRLLTGMT